MAAVAERASVFQRVQIGVESTPGTAVAASKQLRSVGIEPTPKMTVQQFRPAGSKYVSLAIEGQEWSTAAISGNATYDELVYPLSSILGAATVTTVGTTGHQWVFNPSVNTPDNVKTFTIQHGDPNYTDQMTYGIFDELSFTMDRTKFELGGSILAQLLQTVTQVGTVSTLMSTGAPVTSIPTTALTGPVPSGSQIILTSGVNTQVFTSTAAAAQGATTIPVSSQTPNFAYPVGTTVAWEPAFTPAPTLLPLQPIVPSTLNVFADSVATNIGTTRLSRVLAFEWHLASRFGPIWTLDSTQASWAAAVETVPALTATMTMEADNVGMSFLNNVRVGQTLFVRVSAAGPVIAGGTANYSFILDIPVKVVDTQGFSDSNGVYAIQWSFVGVYDSTFNGTGGAMLLTLINSLAAL